MNRTKPASKHSSRWWIVAGLALLACAVVMVIPREEKPVSKIAPPEKTEKPRRSPVRGQKGKSPQDKLQELVRKQAAKPVVVDRPSYALEQIRKAGDAGDTSEIGEFVNQTKKGEFREVWSIINTLPPDGIRRNLETMCLGYAAQTEGIEIVVSEILGTMPAGKQRNFALTIAFSTADLLEDSRSMQEMLVDPKETEAAENGIVLSYGAERLTDNAVKNPLLFDFQPSRE